MQETPVGDKESFSGERGLERRKFSGGGGAETSNATWPGGLRGQERWWM